MPPHSDNKLIFFSYKNLTVDGVRYKNWKHARENSILGELQVMPPSDNDIKRKFVSRKWPCLAKSLEAAKKKGTMSHDASDSLDGRGLTKTKPRPYQSELFRMVTRTERNSLVYLPTGLGKTLVAAMVVKCMSEWNPERLAVFLVETNALAIQQVCTRIVPSKFVTLGFSFFKTRAVVAKTHKQAIRPLLLLLLTGLLAHVCSLRPISKRTHAHTPHSRSNQ